MKSTPETMIKPILNKLFWGVFRHFLNDRLYAKFRYWLETGRKLDLENPSFFTEKIQWLKLHERTELRQKVADRFAVRDYVTQKIGEEHLIPLFRNFNELTIEAWESLPESFVLKANHGCKMVEIVEDKSTCSFHDLQKKTKEWQNTDYYKFGREWVYKNVPRTIIAEKLLKTADGHIPNDYKFYCFHGRVELVQIDFGRFGNHTRNLYDKEFNLQPITFSHPQYDGPVEKHPLFSDAVDLAKTLAGDFNFIRVDLYLLENHIYFGELTNFPANGFIPFKPDRAELELGQKLRI